MRSIVDMVWKLDHPCNTCRLVLVISIVSRSCGRLGWFMFFLFYIWVRERDRESAGACIDACVREGKRVIHLACVRVLGFPTQIHCWFPFRSNRYLRRGNTTHWENHQNIAPQCPGHDRAGERNRGKCIQKSINRTAVYCQYLMNDFWRQRPGAENKLGNMLYARS